MTRGVVLLAHNSDTEDYYKLAVFTAKRINTYLDLPVTIITDENSVTDYTYNFDKTIFTVPDKSNFRRKTNWINKGRYQVYEHSPYDETLLLDVDYQINSQKLLKTFEIPGDFLCHKDVHWFFDTNGPEHLHTTTLQTLWATVVRFNKCSRSEQVFGMIKMIQENYEHYANLYKFQPYQYRNDYALTIALKTVNGQLESNQDYIPWKLCHIGPQCRVYKETETSYVIFHEDKKTQKRNYIKIRDMDFHMLHKKNFLEINQ